MLFDAVEDSLDEHPASPFWLDGFSTTPSCQTGRRGASRTAGEKTPREKNEQQRKKLGNTYDQLALRSILALNRKSPTDLAEEAFFRLPA